MASTAPVLTIEAIAKKYCRRLRHAMWYALSDVAAELLVAPNRSHQLRAGEYWALRDVSLQLPRGESLGLIGHNGAGKTTLLKLVQGLIKPDAGRIEVRGRVGALTALGAGFNPLLSGRENVYINGAVLGYRRREIDQLLDRIVEFSGLSEFLDAPVQSYSSGMQVRLAFSVAIHLDPDLMLVDEVLAVGDTAFQNKCYDRIAEMRAHGTSFVIVTHNPYQVERLCERVAVLDHGSLQGVLPGRDAIMLYERLCAAGAGAEGKPHARGGSGQVRVESVQTFGAGGEPAREFDAFDTLEFRVRLTATIPTRELRLRLEVYSTSGVLVALISTLGETEHLTFDGASDLTFRADKCLLTSGRYYVDAIVAGQNTRFDVFSHACEFSVALHDPRAFALCTNRGVFVMDGRWSVS